MNKKGWQEPMPKMLVFLALILVLVIIIYTSGSLQNTQEGNSTIYNMTEKGVSIFKTFSNFVIVPIIMIFVVLLYWALNKFSNFGGKKI